MTKLYKPKTYKPSAHTHDYQTDITNKPSLGTMAAVNDAPSDDKTYGRKNGAWAEASGGSGSVAWGSITGTLSNQTDLQSALDLKAPISPVEQTLSASDMTLDTGVTLNGTNKVYKFGKICILLFDIKLTGITSSAVKKITGYLPSGFRPASNTIIMGSTGSTDGKLQSAILYTGGALWIYPVNTGTTYAQGTAVYIIA